MKIQFDTHLDFQSDGGIDLVCNWILKLVSRKYEHFHLSGCSKYFFELNPTTILMK